MRTTLNQRQYTPSSKFVKFSQFYDVKKDCFKQIQIMQKRAQTKGELATKKSALWAQKVTVWVFLA